MQARCDLRDKEQTVNNIGMSRNRHSPLQPIQHNDEFALLLLFQELLV
jgi:hypothetical protein